MITDLRNFIRHCLIENFDKFVEKRLRIAKLIAEYAFEKPPIAGNVRKDLLKSISANKSDLKKFLWSSLNPIVSFQTV